MKLCLHARKGLTIVELMVTTVLFGVFGLIVYSLLNLGTILGAKNTAVNTAHQQARTAMLQMLQDLHGSVSVPELINASGGLVSGEGPAAGIRFQLYAQGPLQISANASAGQKVVKVRAANAITVGQHLIVRSHEIEDDIAAVSGPTNVVNGIGTYSLTMTNNLPVKIDVSFKTSVYNVVCYITDRCSYTVIPSVPQPPTGFSGSLQWNGPNARTKFAVLGSDITAEKPFKIPVTGAGALYHRFVAAIDLSTADRRYTARKFKSANILLNGEVPMRAKLADKP